MKSECDEIQFMIGGDKTSDSRCYWSYADKACMSFLVHSLY